MDETGKDAVCLFDTLYTTNHIQMLKILLPYLNVNIQNQLALYIKFQEFKYTYTYIQTYNRPIFQEKKRDFDIQSLNKQITPYCTDEEVNKIRQLLSVFQNLDQINEFKKYMPLFESLMSNSEHADGPHLENMLKGMLSEEQLNLFHTFQSNNDT